MTDGGVGGGAELLDDPAARGLPGTGSPLVAEPPGWKGGLSGGMTRRPLSTFEEVYLRMLQHWPLTVLIQSHTEHFAPAEEGFRFRFRTLFAKESK